MNAREKTRNMHITVIIPAYNEEKTVGEVVKRVLSPHPTLSHGEREAERRVRVLVVNDGSSDRTAQVAREAGATVLSHPINRGLGAALSTGIEGALRLLHNAPQPPLNLIGEEGGVIVTLDADGQHDPAEIPRVIEPILKGGAEVVIGTRFKVSGVRCQVSGIPWARRVANTLGNLFTWLLFGIWVTDSQSGFRAFSADAARRLRLRTSTMEVSSEIIREIARLKFRFVEVPITAQYTPYSLAKGQNFRRGIETLWKLIVLKFFR